GFHLESSSDEVQARLVADSKKIDASSVDEGSLLAIGEIRKLANEAAAKRAAGEGPDEALEAIDAATRARARDPKIKGRAVILEAKGDLWLTGDLHGNVENLRRFAEAAALDANPDRIFVVQEIIHSRVITSDQRDLSFVAILEALKLVARYPGRVYYLLGNHDLAFGLGRDLVKGGKSLNRYLYKGMAFMYQARHEEVAQAYMKFIRDMPAAIVAPNGVFMSHSTPKKPYIPSLSMEYLTTTSAKLPLEKCGPIKALVEGRDFEEPTIKAFTERMETDFVVCGHTPTPKGFRVANSRQLIIDSQHANGRYVTFDLTRRYTMDELMARVKPILGDEVSSELVGELM
ncbi:metallophosphoesterase, partial [bacterium]|nr:metallophosphoesterase [bacterium]